MEILTVKLLVLNKEEAKVLWDAHMKNAVINGCAVQGLSWGDMFEERDKLEEIVNAALETTLELDGDLPEELILPNEEKKFFQWPFGIYSVSDKTALSEEWYPSLEAVMKKYPHAVSILSGAHNRGPDE